MREIKFRFINPDGELYTLTLKELTELDEGMVYSEDFRGEWTGLKDKNGKEIYEGDILDTNGDWHGNPKVVFHSGRFCIEIDSNKNDCKYDDLYFGEGIYQVIGNIYENPELLTN